MRGRGASVGRKGRVRMAIRGDVGPGGVGGRQCEGRQGKAWQGKADRVKGWGAEPRMVVYRRVWCWRVVYRRAWSATGATYILDCSISGNIGHGVKGTFHNHIHRRRRRAVVLRLCGWNWDLRRVRRVLPPFVSVRLETCAFRFDACFDVIGNGFDDRERLDQAEVGAAGGDRVKLGCAICLRLAVEGFHVCTDLAGDRGIHSSGKWGWKRKGGGWGQREGGRVVGGSAICFWVSVKKNLDMCLVANE